MAGISRVTFTESNDARPTYFFAGVTVALIAIDQILLSISSSSTRSIYICSAFCFLIAAICGLNCILGCIWHPIPIERRTSGQITSLHLDSFAAAPTAKSDQMFESLEQRLAEDQEESVDASQVEVRDPIQWVKFSLVSGCLGCCIFLIVYFGH